MPAGTTLKPAIPPPPIKPRNMLFLKPATSVYSTLPTEIIDSILAYLCLLQAESISSLALSMVSSKAPTEDETPLPPLRSRRRASPTVALLPILCVNSYFNRLAQRRLYAEVITRGARQSIMFMQTMVRSYNRETRREASVATVISGSKGMGGGGGGKDRDTDRPLPLRLVKSLKVDISGEIGVLGGFYTLLHRTLRIFAGLSTSTSLTELHLDFPETHSPISLLEGCTPLSKKLRVFSTSMHCQRPLARALGEMDELRELTLRGFQREVDRSVFPVVGATDNWGSDDEETADEADSDGEDGRFELDMNDEDDYEWEEFPRSVSGGGSSSTFKRKEERRPRHPFYLPRKALKNLKVFNAIHSRPGIIREVLRGRDVKVVSVPVFSGLGMQTLDAVARAGKRREEERRKRRELRRAKGNGKERETEGDTELGIAPLPPPSVRRLSIISFDPDSPAYLLPELVKRFGTPGWDVRLATMPPRSRHADFASGSTSRSAPKSKRAKTHNSDGTAKGHRAPSKCNTGTCEHKQAYSEPDPDDCQLEALHLVVLLAECNKEMLEDNAKWLGAFKGLRNMTYMAASSNSRSPPPPQPPPPHMPPPALPPPPSNPPPGPSLSPAPFDITPSTSSTSLATTSSTSPTSFQPSTSSSSSLSLPSVSPGVGLDEDQSMHDDLDNTNPNGESSTVTNINGTNDAHTASPIEEDNSSSHDPDHDTDTEHPDPFFNDPEMTLDEAEIARMWHKACPSLDTIILPMGKVWFRRI
ncbi:hypothetical protein BJ165DRAFT_364654 [Panaeolus papilionaceus]|nr:hypothetical protein BJ165DRAFT_364654 [Panaeolus papilionaceus]